MRAYATIYTSGPATIEGVHADFAIIHASKMRGTEMTSTYVKEKAALFLSHDWTRSNCPLECKPANLYLRLIRVAHMTPCLFASD